MLTRRKRNLSSFKTDFNPECPTKENEHLVIRYINEIKGRGVFAKKNFEKGEFLTTYAGKMCFKCPQNSETYVFEFCHKHIQRWIDATEEDETHGRIINDDHRQPNCRIEVKEDIKGVPHLCIFAKKFIAVGDELTYNYGSNSKCYPWRKKKVTEEDAPPREEHLPPTVDDNFVPEKDAPPREEHLLPTVDDNFVPTQNFSNTGCISDIQVTEEDAPPREEHLPPTVDDNFVPEKDAPPREEHLLPTVDDNFVPTQNFSNTGCISDIQVTEEDAPPREEHLPPTVDDNFVPEKDAPPREEHFPPTVDDNFVPTQNFSNTGCISDIQNYLKNISMELKKRDQAIDHLKVQMKLLKRKYEARDTSKRKRLKKDSFPLPVLNERISEDEESLPGSDEEIVPETDSEDSDLDCNNEYPMKPPQNQEGIQVRQANNLNGIRKWDKVQYCVYCKEGSTCLRRHLLTKHQNEKDVTRILAMNLRSKERKIYLEKLRNQGNFHHNMNVLKEEKGVIVPWRCPPNYVSYKKYLPCKFCLAFFFKTDLWKHLKKCSHRKKSDNAPDKRVMTEASLMLPSSPELNKIFAENILSHMSNDDLTLIVKYDWLILSYGQKIYKKRRDMDNAHLYISQKMREIARLLKTLRTLNDQIKHLEDCLDTKYFRLIIDAVHKLAGFSEETGTYKTPSLALKLGHSLKKCAMIKSVKAYETKNDQVSKESERFVRMLEIEWESEISSLALTTLDRNKWNKPTILPIAEDTMKVNCFIKNEIKILKEKVEKDPNREEWACLSKLVLASVILFNRKRSGEASKITLKDFEKRRENVNSSDIETSLSAVERHICRTFARVEIRGKRGRKVPVIFTPLVSEALMILAETRDSVGVEKENKYLFPYTHSGAKTHIRGHDCLKKCVLASGVQNPESITSTKLRKHIGTFSQILNLQEYELEQLANFMGHDISVHRGFYRLPEDTYQLAKVVKLLIALEEGKFAQYKGKSLEEIEVNFDQPIEESPIEDSFEESSEAVAVSNNTTSNNDEGILCAYNPSKLNQQSVSEDKRDPEYKPSDTEDEVTENLVPQKRKRSKFLRHRWTIAETNEARRIFDSFYRLRTLPGKHEIESAKRNSVILSHHNWEKIKQLCRRQIREIAKCLPNEEN